MNYLSPLSIFFLVHYSVSSILTYVPCPFYSRGCYILYWEANCHFPSHIPSLILKIKPRALCLQILCHLSVCPSLFCFEKKFACLSVCLYMHHLHDLSHRGKKTMLELLELKLGMVVSHHVGSRN